MQPTLTELSSSSTRTKLASNTFLSCDYSSFHSAVEAFDDSLPKQRKSVLVVGATGRTGTACIQALAEQAQDQVTIHAFCRDPSTLRLEIAVLCDSVHSGDARNPRDLQRAMDRTRADTVLICVGSRAHEGHRPTVRTDNAHAMVQVVKGFSHHHHHHGHRHHHTRHTSRGSRDRDSNTHTYDHVHMIVLSHSGSQAQPTRQRRVRSTIDKRNSRRHNNHSMRKVFHRCHVDHRVLEDHWGQENHFMTLKSQTTVVRPTVLTQGSPKGHISSVCKASTSSSSAQLQLDQVLGGSASSSMERRQSSSLLIEMTDLVDLADWMVQEVLTQRHRGQTVNVCSRRHSQHDDAEPATATQ